MVQYANGHNISTLGQKRKNFMDKKNNKKTTTATTGQEKKIDRIKRKANEWSGVFTIAAFILAFLAVPVAAGKWIERLNNVVISEEYMKFCLSECLKEMIVRKDELYWLDRILG